MKRVIVLALSLLFVSCGLIPNTPLMLNEPDDLNEFSSDSLGVVAFKVAQNNGATISIDFKNLNTDENYRLKVNPSFSNYVSFSVFGAEVASSEIEKEVVDKDIVFYGLPAGDYIPVYKYYHIDRDNHSGLITSGSKFSVKKNEISSLGKADVDFKYEIFQSTILEIEFDGSDISKEIKQIENSKISPMKISNYKLVLE